MEPQAHLEDVRDQRRCLAGVEEGIKEDENVYVYDLKTPLLAFRASPRERFVENEMDSVRVGSASR